MLRSVQVTPITMTKEATFVSNGVSGQYAPSVTFRNWSVSGFSRFRRRNDNLIVGSRVKIINTRAATTNDEISLLRVVSDEKTGCRCPK